MEEANLNGILEQVAKEKGIAMEVMVGALEEAILAAAKKSFGLERNLTAKYNRDKGFVDLSQAIVVVAEVTDTFNEISLERCEEYGIEVEAGDEMVFPIYYLDQDAALARQQDDDYGDILGLKTYRRSFGRVAAQAAKQVIVQRFRDAERNQVYGEYKDRRGELVSGIAARFERGNIIINLGRAEAILPFREQCARESYRTGDRIQAYVKEVQEHARGPQIVLSRTAPELLVKLFELEVPEIYEGVVRIESAAREPGIRAKIAVASRDRDVDPVGACVGMKGARVQAVVQELRGEKIDIVPWSPDPATFVCNALQPAEVSRVLIDEGNRSMEIIVPDDQLSLAIGRRGQNVRLASQLSGWRLDIHSESRIQEIKQRAWESLGKVKGVNEFLIQTLYNHGIRSAEQLLTADRRFLLEFPGVTDEVLESIRDSARDVAEIERREAVEHERDAERASLAATVARDLQGMLGLDAVGRVRRIRGIGDTTFDTLEQHDLIAVEKLAEATVESLTAVGLTEQKAKQVIYGAGQLLKHEDETQHMAQEFGIVVEDGVAKTPAQLEEEARRREAAQAAAQVADASAGSSVEAGA
jgi:N utilization substance protein A